MSQHHDTSEVGPVPQEAATTKSTTQSKIGLIFIKGFLLIVSGVIFITLIQGYPVLDIKDLLLAISGILSGPLGFIIGFYFKEEVQKNNS